MRSLTKMWHLACTAGDALQQSLGPTTIDSQWDRLEKVFDHQDKQGNPDTLWSTAADLYRSCHAERCSRTTGMEEYDRAFRAIRQLGTTYHAIFTLLAHHFRLSPDSSWNAEKSLRTRRPKRSVDFPKGRAYGPIATIGNYTARLVRVGESVCEDWSQQQYADFFFSKGRVPTIIYSEPRGAESACGFYVCQTQIRTAAAVRETIGTQDLRLPLPGMEECHVERFGASHLDPVSKQDIGAFMAIELLQRSMSRKCAVKLSIVG